MTLASRNERRTTRDALAALARAWGWHTTEPADDRRWCRLDLYHQHANARVIIDWHADGDSMRLDDLTTAVTWRMHDPDPDTIHMAITRPDLIGLTVDTCRDLHRLPATIDLRGAA